MSGNKRKTDLSTKLFIAAAAFLCLILLVEAIVFIKRIDPSREYEPLTPDTILHELNRGAYMDAMYSVRYNRTAGITEKQNQDYAVPYAAVDYFEAASYYVAYGRSGQADMAQAYREKMEDAYQRMGDLQFLTEKIDAELGVVK